MISQRSKLTLRTRHSQIDFIFGCLAVVVAEGREILSKNAHIWEISFDEINLEKRDDSTLKAKLVDKSNWFCSNLEVDIAKSSLLTL